MNDIDCHLNIYEREGVWWLQITSDLFGPFDTDDDAIDAIPNALRSTFE